MYVFYESNIFYEWFSFHVQLHNQLTTLVLVLVLGCQLPAYTMWSMYMNWSISAIHLILTLTSTLASVACFNAVFDINNRRRCPSNVRCVHCALSLCDSFIHVTRAVWMSAKLHSQGLLVSASLCKAKALWPLVTSQIWNDTQWKAKPNEWVCVFEVHRGSSAVSPNSHTHTTFVRNNKKNHFHVSFNKYNKSISGHALSTRTERTNPTAQAQIEWDRKVNICRTEVWHTNFIIIVMRQNARGDWWWWDQMPLSLRILIFASLLLLLVLAFLHLVAQHACILFAPYFRLAFEMVCARYILCRTKPKGIQSIVFISSNVRRALSLNATCTFVEHKINANDNHWCSSGPRYTKFQT